MKISLICSQVEDKELILTGNVNRIADESNNVDFEEEMTVPTTMARALDSHANTFVESVRTGVKNNIETARLKTNVLRKRDITPKPTEKLIARKVSAIKPLRNPQVEQVLQRK